MVWTRPDFGCVRFAVLEEEPPPFNWTCPRCGSRHSSTETRCWCELERRDDESILEAIVGARRHPTAHIGRAVSSERRVFILHSEECRRRLGPGGDLWECPFSDALSEGIDVETAWRGFEDMPVVLDILDGRLVPVREEEAS